MPRVPIYNEQQVQQRGLPNVQQSMISMNAPNPLAGLGKAMSGAVDELDKQRRYADELRAEEAFNQLREKQLDLTYGQDNGFLNIKGKNALPVQGITLQDRWGNLYGNEVNKIRDQLGNDNQKAIFQRYADRAGVEFGGTILRHEKQETDTWRKQVVDGVFAVESDNAAKNWNNRQAINLSRSRIDMNLGKLRDADGVPADQLDKIRIGVMSKLHAGVLDAAIESRNLNYASDYIKEYGSEIEASTLLRAKSHINKEVKAQYAFKRSGEIINQFNDAFDPDDFSRLTNLVAKQESGGRERKANGDLITSEKGAKGQMQVLDGTKLDPGFGVTPARDESDSERTRVGRDYLAAMVKRYGDVGMALAAYNAGPGTLDKALKQAKQDGKENQWLTYLPKETQQYVPAIVSQYSAGAGRRQMPTFLELDSNLRADPYLQQNPDAYKMAREQLKQQFDERKQAYEQKQKDTEGELYRQLYANGGNWQAISPSLKSSIDPTKLDSAMKFAADAKRGVPRVTSPALYYSLSNNPQRLKTMTDNEFYALMPELDEGDFKHFSNERAKLNGKAVGSGATSGDLNTGAINLATNQRLASMKIDPTPKDGTSDAVRVGAIKQFINRSLLDAQASTGKKFDDAETIKHIDGLFTNSVELKGFFGGKSNVAMLTMKPGDVPSDFADSIKKIAKDNGMADPTPADILQMYWMKKFVTKDSALKSAKAPKQSLVDQIPK